VCQSEHVSAALVGWPAGMPPLASVDPTPLSPAQIWALIVAATRELSWGMRAVSRASRGWRAMAEAIPDAPIRDDALYALEHKRAHADGAALFTILPRRRERDLLTLLVAYETMLDFLDNLSERHPTPRNGQQLHRALIDAVDPDGPVTDYYRYHPWSDDGGYLAALVDACRQRCCRLPSFERVRVIVRREARRALVLGLNHDSNTQRRDEGLRAWAEREYPDQHELRWFELTGAASASLIVLVLLTLAAEPDLTDADVRSAYAAHWPWIALATTMLDSYVDQADDAASRSHSYISHYPDPEFASRRLRECVVRALLAARGLRDGHRHTVIVGCMIAMYLSKDSARAAELHATTSDFVAAGGSLVRLLLPILRAWRLLYRQRAA
jgi:tetraprenyl-beta-curcumene synthase